MLKIPSPVFDKKKIVEFMNWEKKKKLPSVLSSVLSKKKGAIKVTGPVPIAKLVGTMVQDSVQKKERQCKKKKKK